MTLTMTVVAAFRNSFQAACRDAGSKWAAQAHADEVASAADWAGTALDGTGLGFTCHASHGGGAGWDTEAGVTFVFANLGVGGQERAQVHAFAEALRAREDQDAVLVLERAEGFALVERPRA